MLPVCIKALYHLPFLNLNIIHALGLTINHGLIFRQIQEKRTKVMVPNSGMKHKFKNSAGISIGLVFDFVLYFITL